MRKNLARGVNNIELLKNEAFNNITKRLYNTEKISLDTVLVPAFEQGFQDYNPTPVYYRVIGTTDTLKIFSFDKNYELLNEDSIKYNDIDDVVIVKIVNGLNPTNDTLIIKLRDKREYKLSNKFNDDTSIYDIEEHLLSFNVKKGEVNNVILEKIAYGAFTFTFITVFLTMIF